MKQTKASWLGLLTALVISGGAFVGCQKDAKSPELVSNATAAKVSTNWGNFQVQITTSGVACPGTPFDVGGKLVGSNGNTVNPNGNKVLTITPLGTNETDPADDGTPVVFENSVDAATQFTYTEAGTYYFKITFDVNDNSGNNKTVSTTTAVTVSAAYCDGNPDPNPCAVTLVASRVDIALTENMDPTGTYAVQFTVYKSGACPAPTEYKLQGGLTSGTVVDVSGTTVTSSGTGPYKTLGGVYGTLRKATGNQTNSSINWVNSPVLQDGPNYFWVEFAKPTKTSDPYLTGSWSVKGAGFPDVYAPRVTVK